MTLLNIQLTKKPPPPPVGGGGGIFCCVVKHIYISFVVARLANLHFLLYIFVYFFNVGHSFAYVAHL
jgi:hypothetical protein